MDRKTRDIKVKICGQTSLSDCELSVRHGADYLGVVVGVSWSPRSQSVENAAPIFEKFSDRTFLLTFDQEVNREYFNIIKELNPYALQLTGRETPEQVRHLADDANVKIYKSIHLPPAGEEADMERLYAAISEYENAGVTGFIVDTSVKGMFGGSGVSNDWGLAAKLVALTSKPVFLAGGINSDNVALAASTPGIYGVDLASGAEGSVKGVKSEEKIKDIFNSLKPFANKTA